PHFKEKLLLLYVYLYVFLYLYVYLYVSKCLVLSVVVPVHFICFTVGEWETFLSIPCMSDMQEIDNKATLTLTLTLIATARHLWGNYNNFTQRFPHSNDMRW